MIRFISYQAESPIVFTSTEPMRWALISAQSILRKSDTPPGLLNKYLKMPAIAPIRAAPSITRGFMPYPAIMHPRRSATIPTATPAIGPKVTPARIIGRFSKLKRKILTRNYADRGEKCADNHHAQEA